jgi:hypothetical protein
MNEEDEVPICQSILFAGSDPSDKTVSVQFSVGGDLAMNVHFSLGVIGPLMAVLAAESRKLLDPMTEEDRNVSATLRAKAVWLAQDADGDPMMVFELQNGTRLPLVAKSGDLAGLAREMGLLGAPTEGRQ